MDRWIALFRGINVGGHHRLSMAGLKALLTGLGFTHIRTYIQSGNVVFEGPGPARDLEARIGAAVAASYGFSPRVLCLTPDELTEVITSNPYPEAAVEPKSLHVSFLSTTPDSPDLSALEEVRASSERFELIHRAFYLHAPDGIARSRLAQRVEVVLGVPATSRNWRTVSKIQELAAC